MYNQKILVYFGDKKKSLVKEVEQNITIMNELAIELGVSSLWGARQVHGVNYALIDDTASGAFITALESDIIITQKKRVGVSVFTADCVPILLYAPDKEVVAAVHAGWKGAVAGVAGCAIDYMIEKYGIDPAGVKVFFGPSIKVCCFEVGQEVIEAVQKTPYARLALYEWEDRVVCDLLELSVQSLISRGCTWQNMDRRQNVCTRCHPEYNSYRRSKENAGRQISIIALL